MGACVLCGKDAGIFRVLHKNCYQDYLNQTDNIVEEILQLRDNQIEVESLAARLIDYPGTKQFTQEARERTLVKALEKFASSHLKSKSDICQLHTVWTDLLRELALKEALFLDANFLTQQFNLPAVAALYQDALPQDQINSQHETNIDLAPNESLWWCFEKVELILPNAKSATKQWSVAQHLIKTWLPRNKEQTLDVHQAKELQLWISDQRLLLQNQDETISLQHASIYSVTPREQGVTLQLKDAQALPQHIQCEDGRLLYLLVKHAQSLRSQHP